MKAIVTVTLDPDGRNRTFEKEFESYETEDITKVENALLEIGFWECTFNGGKA